MLQCSEHSEILLTHGLVPSGPIPTAYDPDGLYPYESFCETSNSPVLKAYRMVSIENDHLRVKICPDLGGRVCSLQLKQDETECLFFPHVIRPCRILPRQAFTGGGIELSFPISHSPVQISRVLYEVHRDPRRVYISCGEREIKFGMHWAVEYSLGENDKFLTQRTVFFNPDLAPHPWMSWSNAGVPACPDTQFHFPGGPVLVHERELRIIDWHSQGPKQQSDLHRMTGFFWKDPDCGAFGVFTPSLRAGLYHVADRAEVPGIKLWSDGIGRDEEWVGQYTLDGSQCLEIQAGPAIDQSIKSALLPGAVHSHTEFWIPSVHPLDIRQTSCPRVNLRPIEHVPFFGWARSEEVRIWIDLVAAHETQNATGIPKPPTVESNVWAISGMAELGPALSWAASATHGSDRDKWLLQLASWLAGRGDPSGAIEALLQSCDDRARALCGRLYLTHKNDARRSAECFRAIVMEAIALHPQVVVDRDKALAALGPETLEQRRQWLDAVSALEDGRLVERRAHLLHDSGDSLAAMRVLKSFRFQRQHQRHQRTRLWREIEDRLGIDQERSLEWLGEDDLAEFGAYREHPEIG